MIRVIHVENLRALLELVEVGEGVDVGLLHHVLHLGLIPHDRTVPRGTADDCGGA